MLSYLTSILRTLVLHIAAALAVVLFMHWVLLPADATSAAVLGMELLALALTATWAGFYGFARVRGSSSALRFYLQRECTAETAAQTWGMFCVACIALALGDWMALPLALASGAAAVRWWQVGRGIRRELSHRAYLGHA